MPDAEKDLGPEQARDEEDDEPEIYYDIPPLPTDETYPNLETVQEIIRIFTKEHGYALSKLRSKSVNGKVFKVDYQCDRGKRLASRPIDGVPQRKRASRRLGCPFSATAVLLKKKGGWMIRIRDARHNHKPSPVENLTIHRRHDLIKHREEIKNQVCNGVRPSDIIDTLKKENPDITLMVRDIYNHRKSFLNDQQPYPTARTRKPESSEITALEEDTETKIMTIYSKMQDVVNKLVSHFIDTMKAEVANDIITSESEPIVSNYNYHIMQEFEVLRGEFSTNSDSERDGRDPMSEKIHLMHEYISLKASLAPLILLRTKEKSELLQQIQKMKKEEESLRKELKSQDSLIAELHVERNKLRAMNKDSTDKLKSINSFLANLNEGGVVH